MKNYYEILEVSNKASKEIIDKAYKILAKKYHPDANPTEKKSWAEENFKKINEAYEVLSDEEKRKKYDIELERKKEELLNKNDDIKARYQKLYEQNQILQQELQNLKLRQPVNSNNINNVNSGNSYNVNTINMQEEINRKVSQSVDKAYYDAYIQRMRDYGYKIYHKKTLKERVKDLISVVFAILVIMLILIILWQIPAFREYIESNEIIMFFINAFTS